MATVVHRGSDGRNIGHDLTGQQFGKLTILRQTGEKDKNGYLLWEAMCDCGNSITRPSYRYVRGNLKTCGCGPLGRPRIPNNGAHINAIHGTYKKSAKERGLKFELNRDDIRTLVEQPCCYCGSPPLERRFKNLAGLYAWNGIDRVDNSKGYVPDNCAPCCQTCNQGKMTMSITDFRDWITRVYNHSIAA